MEDIKNVPEIRFGKFNDEWKMKILGDENISILINEKVSIDKVRLNDYISTDNMLADYAGITTAKKIPTNNNLTKFLQGDILLSNIRPYLKKVWRAQRDGVASNDVLVFRAGTKLTSIFLESIIKNDAFINYVMLSVKGVKMPRGDKDAMVNYSFYLPEVDEQKLIANVFQNLDSSIKNHNTQLKKLTNLKKAMLIKMFPQDGAGMPEIRFKGFDGEWDLQQLGNIGNTFTGLSGKTKEDFGKGNAKYIPYTNVFNNEVIDINQLEKIEIDNTQSSLSYGDVLFTTSSETPEEVGMSSVWLENKENVYLNSFCFGYRFNQKVDYLYIAFYLRSKCFRDNIKVLAQGISRFNISKTKAMDIEISLPRNINEQQKIGNYFKNLDNLITNHKEQLKKLNQIKKACLSKLFVSQE
jgi:type I restriction enzyme S subunit